MCVFVVEPAVTSVGDTDIVPEPSAALTVTVGEPAVSAVNVAPTEPSYDDQVAAVPTAGTVTGPYVIVSVSPALIVRALRLIRWAGEAERSRPAAARSAIVVLPAAGVGQLVGALQAGDAAHGAARGGRVGEGERLGRAVRDVGRSTVIVPEPLGA